MAFDRARRVPDDATFSDRLPPSRVALLVVPLLLAGAVVLANVALIVPTGPFTLTAGVENATPEELTTAAAEALDAALTRGAGITFEIVQTTMVVARPGGPLVDIPDPDERTVSLGQAKTYALGTLVERGQAGPDGFWMELLHGPQPGAEADYRLDHAQLRREALVRDGITYRNDGQGWHPTDQPPGIGLDPVTVGLLPALLTGASDTRDAPPRPTKPADPSPPPDDAFTRATTPLVAADVAARITGLDGPATPVARTLEGTTTPEAVPGIIAVDLVEHTELLAPVELRFDVAGHLVGLTVLARNTRLDVHDLVVETYLTIRYPDKAPELPMPQPTYVAPTQAPDEAAQ